MVIDECGESSFESNKCTMTSRWGVQCQSSKVQEPRRFDPLIFSVPIIL